MTVAKNSKGMNTRGRFTSLLEEPSGKPHIQMGWMT